MVTARQWLTALLTRRYPLLSGCGSIANSRIVRFAAGCSKKLVWTRIDSGPLILVPLDDYVGRAVFFVGDLDRKISKICERIVRPGDTVIDIGANLGVVTLQLAKLVGTEGSVHSFEPNPAIAQILAQSVEKNGFINVHLNSCALGAVPGILELAVPNDNAGGATLTPDRVGDDWKRVQVPVRTLASAALELGFKNVRLMKIDVEGFELEVLRGAEQWLTSFPPDVILFESNEKRGEREVNSVLRLLLDSGYNLYSVPKAWFTIRLAPFRSGDAGTGISHDMLAVHKECNEQIVSRFTRR